MITIDRMTETEPGEIIEALLNSGLQVLSWTLSRNQDDGTLELLGAKLEKIDITPKKMLTPDQGVV